MDRNRAEVLYHTHVQFLEVYGCVFDDDLPSERNASVIMPRGSM